MIVSIANSFVLLIANIDVTLYSCMEDPRFFRGCLMQIAMLTQDLYESIGSALRTKSKSKFYSQSPKIEPLHLEIPLEICVRGRKKSASKRLYNDETSTCLSADPIISLGSEKFYSCKSFAEEATVKSNSVLNDALFHAYETSKLNTETSDIRISNRVSLQRLDGDSSPKWSAKKINFNLETEKFYSCESLIDEDSITFNSKLIYTKDSWKQHIPPTHHNFVCQCRSKRKITSCKSTQSQTEFELDNQPSVSSTLLSNPKDNTTYINLPESGNSKDVALVDTLISEPSKALKEMTFFSPLHPL